MSSAMKYMDIIRILRPDTVRMGEKIQAFVVTLRNLPRISIDFRAFQW
jgi:hypothetical protein